MTKKKTFFGVAIIALLLVAMPALAADFAVGEVYTLSENEQVEDFYVAGGNVVISGTTNDITAAGGKVLLLGDATGDILAAGGTVDILGTVGDDIRVAGGEITIGTNVPGDLVIAGGAVHILEGSIVQGDVFVAGGEVIIDGTIEKDLQVYGGKTTLNGLVVNNANISVDEAFMLGEKGAIGGNLTYESPVALSDEDQNKISGEIAYEGSSFAAAEKTAGFLLAGILGAALLARLLMLIVAALVLVWFFKGIMQKVASYSLEHFGKSTLIGFAALILVPVASVILLVSVFGMMLGFIGLASYVLVLMLAKVCAGILTGAALSQWIKKQAIVDWKWAILGVLALEIISIIPLIGWFVGFVIFLAALGSLVVFVRHCGGMLTKP